MIKGLNRVLSDPQMLGEGFVWIPFGFTINGTSTPTAVKGPLASVAYSEAGEFLCTLLDNSVPKQMFVGLASVSNTADDVDMYAIVDWSTVVSAGTFVVRTMTGSTQTDPTSGLLVGGFLLGRKTDR